MAGITTRETDLSVAITSQINGTPAAIIFESVWGPVLKIHNTNNEEKFVDIFGKPKSFQTNYQLCINYMQYSSNILSARVSSGNNSRGSRDKNNQGWLWNSSNSITWQSNKAFVELNESI